jgi:sulfoxide reductase catalytic subunit YedY
LLGWAWRAQDGGLEPNDWDDIASYNNATELQIGGGLFSPRIPTKIFNGYETEVASLYDGMDLSKNF